LASCDSHGVEARGTQKFGNIVPRVFIPVLAMLANKHPDERQASDLVHPANHSDRESRPIRNSHSHKSDHTFPELHIALIWNWTRKWPDTVLAEALSDIGWNGNGRAAQLVREPFAPLNAGIAASRNISGSLSQHLDTNS
jgi:hypothetical protein